MSGCGCGRTNNKRKKLKREIREKNRIKRERK